MSHIKFKLLSFRDRGLQLPFGEAIPTFADDEIRVVAIERLRSTLFSAWREFALEHIDDVPEANTADEMLQIFLSAYVGILWQFKRARKGGKSIRKYALSIRVNSHDRVLLVWREFVKLWEARYLDTSDFQDQLIVATLGLGRIHNELEFTASGKMNPAELIIERELQQLKAASKRHAENRAIKADVFAWLDSLTAEFAVIEAAARAIVKQQPITHDTARGWFKEWKKLRSASTP